MPKAHVRSRCNFFGLMLLRVLKLSNVLFYSILFYSFLFCFILLLLFYFYFFILFCFVLSYFILFCFPFFVRFFFSQTSGRTVVVASIEGHICGLFGLVDTVRPEAKDIVAELDKQGLEVWMVTGDNLRVAREVTLPLTNA